MSIYEEEGFASRRQYLGSLAEDFGLDSQTVFAVASILGASEDFDGLLSSLEDLEGDF